MSTPALAIFLQTFLSALIWSIFGYAAKQPEESFEPEKIVSTFIAAFIVAFLSVMWNIDVETGEQMYVIFFLRGGLVAYLEKALKAIWRRWLHDIFYGWMGNGA